jgi:hypothetical protein
VIDSKAPPSGDATFEGFAEAATAPRAPAPTGVMTTCRAVTPPKTDACGAAATHVVLFGDGDIVAVCLACAIHLEQLAESHMTKVKVERITP